MNHSEVFSPVGLLRTLKLVNTINQLRIVQMQHFHFFDFHSTAKSWHFTKIPYMQVREMQYQKGDYSVVKYKIFRSEETGTVNVACQNPARKLKRSSTVPTLSTVKVPY